MYGHTSTCACVQIACIRVCLGVHLGVGVGVGVRVRVYMRQKHKKPFLHLRAEASEAMMEEETYLARQVASKHASDARVFACHADTHALQG